MAHYVPAAGPKAVKLHSGRARFSGTSAVVAGVLMKMPDLGHSELSAVIVTGLRMNPELAAQIAAAIDNWEFVYTVEDGEERDGEAFVPFTVYAQQK